jgi:DNA-directed RNA polymerase subunit RPC12/RpoP
MEGAVDEDDGPWIACPTCAATYVVDPAKVRAPFTIRCPTCGARFLLRREDVRPPPRPKRDVT